MFNQFDLLFAGLVSGMLAWLIGLLMGNTVTVSQWQRMAVAHGAGKYIVDADGGTEFQWNDQAEEK